MRDAVCVQTGFAESYMDVHGVRRVHSKTLRSQLVGVCDHWLFKVEHFHKDRLPIFKIVCLCACSDNVFFDFCQFVGVSIVANLTIMDTPFQEIRCINIVLHHEWQNFFHPFISPIIESRCKKGRSTHIECQVFVLISANFDCILIVFFLERVFLTGNFADTWCP